LITARNRFARFTTVLSVVVMTAGCDQISKAAARSLLSQGHPIRFFNGTLEFSLSHNVGAFLGLGSGLSAPSRYALFSIGGGLLILAGLYHLVTHTRLSNRLVIALSLLLGGAIGNQIDRFAFHGAVTDFLFLSVGPLHTGIFNLADMAVMVGAIYFLFESRRDPNPPLSSDSA
jgi:signal peptidase II